MPKNIVEKIWDAHIVSQQASHPAVFAIDMMLLHEVTSAQAFDMLQERQLPVADPRRCVGTIDHSIPTRTDRHIIHDMSAKKQVNSLRENVKKHGIKFFDFESHHQGIVHVIGPELGITQPGTTIVCGDSHTSTHGAFGALAFGIGTSVVGHVLATGCILLEKPKIMRVHFKGELPKGVYAKDVILKLIAKLGIGGANGYVLEYCGEVIERMSMEERMTVCNMSIECGARAGLIAPDEITFNYLKGRDYAPKGEAWDKAIAYWEQLHSDPDATYDKEMTIDIANMQPMLTWGTNPGQAIQINETIPSVEGLPEHQRETVTSALDYVKLKPGTSLDGQPLDWAFVGSCTNARIEDLRLVAHVLQGRKVASNITFYIVPGSEAVLEQARAEGLDKIFTDAGADFRLPGCSMCIGMNDDKVPEGKRCISSTNRNFVGRQGPGSMTHLASPATVTASAIAGKITSAAEYL